MKFVFKNILEKWTFWNLKNNFKIFKFVISLFDSFQKIQIARITSEDTTYSNFENCEAKFRIQFSELKFVSNF